MMRRLLRVAAIACVVLVPSAAAGQVVAPPVPQGDSLAAVRGRANLERRVQQGIARVIRERVGLSDAQMRQLAPVTRRVEARRRMLLHNERSARQILRRELAAGDSARQAVVAEQLDRLMRIQRQRLMLVQQEQRELAAFMTPVQRARYQAVQENIRRRAQPQGAALERAGQSR